MRVWMQILSPNTSFYFGDTPWQSLKSCTNFDFFLGIKYVLAEEFFYFVVVQWCHDWRIGLEEIRPGLILSSHLDLVIINFKLFRLYFHLLGNRWWLLLIIHRVVLGRHQVISALRGRNRWSITKKTWLRLRHLFLLSISYSFSR